MSQLKYSIHHCTSFAPNYGPENILEDKPHDQSSRWSPDTNYPHQYLILKLDAPALVDSVTFGKFDKTHICNLRRFKIFLGMTDACNVEVLDACLKNDSIPETFDISTAIEGNRVPCLYIKIAPLTCWGASFNLSIWYVSLSGEDDSSVVLPLVTAFQRYEEMQIVKLCLKHFRQQGYFAAFQALTEETGFSLEDECMTELHRLVTSGDYDGVEDFMERALAVGHCGEYIKTLNYRPAWSPLNEIGSVRPGMRGGHQMCIDPFKSVIYLLGGWDGNQDLADFWSYHVPTARWNLISKDTSSEGGPSPRSCHKMVLDLERQQLFVLGRYVDTQCRSQGPLHSDFYMYDIGTSSWTLIAENTALFGGPELLFDHQMCFDSAKRTIYVFGGRVLTRPFLRSNDGGPNVSEMILSGLYSYHVSTNTWTLVLGDSPLPRDNSNHLRSRVGHSMLFHPANACQRMIMAAKVKADEWDILQSLFVTYRKLYIFGGQRSKDYMHDMVTYDVDSGETEILMRHTDPQPPNGQAPSSGYTQRATLDAENDEIYVLSGLSKDKDKRDDNVQYSLWVYSIENNRWSCIHKNEHGGESYWKKMQRVEPCPRFAHQFIYDHVKKVHYLFGGNPGRSSMPKLRLDDFWELHMSRPSQAQLLKKFQFIIRQHRFEEKALENRVEALEFLQTAVYDVIDHENVAQTEEFHALTSLLFTAPDVAHGSTRSVASLRDALFNQLVEYFPANLTQPKANLSDVLRLNDL